MNQTAIGLERGRRAGLGKAKTFYGEMEAQFTFWRTLHPTAADMDFSGAIRELDRKRLADEPSLTHFPELRGHADLLRAERRGFMEASGLDETATAYFYSSDYFMRRPLNAHHLSRYELVTAPDAGCTNVFVPGGAEGVTIGDNRDISLPRDMEPYRNWRPDDLFAHNRDGVHWSQGAVSAAVLLDDEPTCSFPADPFSYTHLLPRECYEDIDVFIAFLTRFNEFWGPGNRILVDRKMNAVAVDKSNCRVAFRKPAVNGAVAVTACAYLDDEMSAHQLERAARAAKIKGESIKDSLDYNYHLGSRKRYQRLVGLTDAAAKGKPTIRDLLDIVSDHAVPYPDRVCLAGESKNYPHRNPNENWSIIQHAAVISGPNQRALYRSVLSRETLKAVYEYPAKLLLAPGVQMKPEWQAERGNTHTAGQSILTPDS
jgi:hypothetical protein